METTEKTKARQLDFPKKVKVLSNRPPLEKLLYPNFLYDKVLKEIKSNNLICNEFSDTLQKSEDLKERIKGKKCTACSLNSKGKAMLRAFIIELKNSSTNTRKIIFDILGRKTIVGIKDNWIDIVNNSITPFEFKSVDVIKHNDSMIDKNNTIPQGPINVDKKPKFILLD